MTATPHGKKCILQGKEGMYQKRYPLLIRYEVSNQEAREKERRIKNAFDILFEFVNSSGNR